MAPQPVVDYVITPHASFEIERRGLSEDVIRTVLAAPEQRLEVRPGRIVLQLRLSMDQPPKLYLVRVFVDVDRHPVEIVTAYRTSNISKYWRENS